MQTALNIIQKVDGERLQRGVEGLTAGAYKITVVLLSKTEIRGFIANSDGQEYGVVLSEEQSFCGCRDAVHWQTVGKRTWTHRGHRAKSAKSFCGGGWGPVAPPVFKTELRGVTLRGWFDSIPSPPIRLIKGRGNLISNVAKNAVHPYGFGTNSSAVKIPRRSSKKALS